MNFITKIKEWYFKKRALPYWCVVFIDCLICYLVGVFVFYMFFKRHVVMENMGVVSRTLLLYLLFNLLGFRFFRTYAGILRYSSILDLKRIAYAMGFACVCVLVIHYPIIFWDENHIFVPLNTRHILGIYFVSTLVMWIFRILVKSVYDSSIASESSLRTLIYGVKAGGIGLANQITNENPQHFKLCGFISHDPHYSEHRLMGEKVYAADEKLTKVIEDEGIQAVIVSPSRNDDFRLNSSLQDLLISKGVRIYMVDNVHEWNQTKHLKEVNIEDLLPRDEISVDLDAVGKQLKGKKILITGSAGSIGSEIVKQVAAFSPSEMMLIDQAETPQHDIRLMMAHDFPHIKATTDVASIINADRMEQIFGSFRPDYVFHAAAYKHVPMMENNPTESVQNNVYGTKVMADLSVKYGVKKFVMISTDKAVNPTNVMGCSKRICEIYVQSLDRAEKEGVVNGNTQFVTTRFGNVLGSNGSVIPLFKKQIQMGGPVTVTDKNIIRYFMLIPEACKLVLEAGTKGHGGEIFVFDMGKPVRIAYLAKRMIMLSGAENVKIEYTGLRPGEKLFEEVLNDEEKTKPTFNPKIKIASVREYSYPEVCRKIERLISISHHYNDMETVKMMKDIVPEFKSRNSIYQILDDQPAQND